MGERKNKKWLMRGVKVNRRGICGRLVITGAVLYTLSLATHLIGERLDSFAKSRIAFGYIAASRALESGSGS